MRLLARISIVCLLSAQAAAAQNIPADSAKIADVDEGRIRYAFAHWWGFSTTDATSQLQSALDSKADTLVITNVGSPWLVTPIFMHHSNRVVIMDRGTVVQAKAGAFRGTHEAMWTIKNLSGITIIGYEGTFRMRKSDYQNLPYTPSEWRHALLLAGSANCSIYGLRLVSSGGDGIYVGPGGSKGMLSYCENILIRDCIADSNHRQGISVTSARHLLIDHCKCSNTRGTDPQAGIDIEPGLAGDDVIDCTVQNSEFFNNKLGLVVGLIAGKLNNPISLTLRNNFAHSNTHASIEFYGPFTPVSGLGTATLIGNMCRPPLLYYPNPHVGLQIYTLPNPEIIFPSQGATGLPASFWVRWRDIPEAQTYHLQLAGDTSFKNLFVNDSTVSDTLLRLGPLQTNIQYYCRVRAKDSSSWSDFSSVLTIGSIDPMKTNVQLNNAIAPTGSHLYQNFPNPFNPRTVIPFELPVRSRVRLTVFSTTGDTIENLLDAEMEAGSYNVVFDGTHLASGVYFYRMEAGLFSQTRKLLLLR